MNRKHWIIAFFGAILFFVWLARTALDDENSSDASPNRSHSQSSQKDRGEDSPPPVRRDTAVLGDAQVGNSSKRGLGTTQALLMPGMVRLTPEVIQTVLKEKENLPLTAAALLLTRDKALWEYAREQMSSQPLLAATIAISGHTDQERLDAANSLISQRPGNPLGYVAALDCYIRLGDTDKINETLASMPPGGQIDAFAQEMRTGSRKLFELSGYDPVEKGLLLSQDSWQYKIVETTSGLTRLYSGDVPQEEKARRASLVLDLIDGYRNLGEEGRSDSALIQLSRAEELTLRRLPEDYQLINGNTVSQEASRLSSERIQEIEKRKRVSDALSVLDYKAIGDYYRVLDEEGEVAAKKWLIGE